MAALLALGQVPTYDGGATGANILQGAPVAGQHSAAELCQVVVTVAAHAVSLYLCYCENFVGCSIT